MAVFTDRAGREWLVDVDAPKIKRVREECKVDLAAPDASQLAALSQDSITVGDVLWVLCRKSAEERGVDNDRFLADVVYGDITTEARRALFDAVLAFTPSQARPAFARLVETMQKAESLTYQTMQDPEFEANLMANIREGLLNTMPSSSATNSPESLESTPAA